MRGCEVCGADISHKRSDAKRCSNACNAKARYARDPRKWIAATTKYAATHREEKRAYHREYARKRREADRAAAGPRYCAQCGAEIIGRDARARFCSELCWERAYRAAKPKRSRSCEGCGVDISHRGGKAKYCSGRCARQVRYARDPEANLARQRVYKGRVREAIFAHFGIQCVDCGSMEELHLDHVNSDGAEHRAWLAEQGLYTSGEHFYRRILANGFDTDGYEMQVLCGPCNRRKAHSSLVEVAS